MKTTDSLWLKVLSMILVLSLLMTAVPNQVYALTGEALGALLRSGQETGAPSAGVNREVYEVTELREESVKHFALEDGTYTAVVYGGPVHTKDAAGNWQDIDNRLSESGSEFVTGNARIKFAKKITGNEVLFTLHDGSRKITMSLDGAIKKTTGAVTNTNTEFDENATQLQKLMTLDKLSCEILYADILSGTDLEYIVNGLNVKENIIVKDRQGSYRYTFTINLNNLEAVLSDDGSVKIVDPATRAAVYTIPAGFMYDAKGAYSTAVTYTLTARGNGRYSLTVAADEAWVNAEDRVFPVCIDPTVAVEGTDFYEQTFIDKVDPDGVLSSYDFLCAGYNTTAYWKMTTLPELPDGAYISKAAYMADTGMTIGWWRLPLGVYEVTGDWDPDTFCYRQYEAGTAGSRASDPYDLIIVPSMNAWDITPYVRKWYADPDSNYGIAIAFPDESEHLQPERQCRFYTGIGGCPITISYTLMGTMADYWSYSSQSAGIAGTGHVNHANGMLSFTIGTLSTTDSLFGLPVSVVYNQKTAGRWVVAANSSIPNITPTMGYGLRLSVNEYIVPKSYQDTSNTEITYYVWTDSDGSEHAFYPVEGAVNEFADDDGLQMTLKVNGNVFTITDTNHTVRTFNRTSSDRKVIKDGALLSKITDKNGNAVRFLYTDWGRVTGVQVIPKGETAISYLYIAYNAYGQAKRIYNPATGDAVKFYYSKTYNASEQSQDHYGFLRRVEHIRKDSAGQEAVVASAAYEYDSAGRLITAKDNTADRWVSYTYTNGQVTAVAEYAGSDGVEGQKLTFDYQPDYTQIRSSGSDDVYGTDDDILNIYTFDALGRVSSYYSTDVNRTILYGASSGEYETQENVKNHIKTSTTVGGVSTNYIFNGGFEYTDLASQASSCWDRTANVSYEKAIGKANDHYSAKFTPRRRTTDSLCQYVQLPEGTYTLSMDVFSFMTEKATAWIRVESLSDETHVFTQAIPLNAYRASAGAMTASINLNAVNADPRLNSGEQFKITVEVTGGDVSYHDDAYILIDNVMLEESIGYSGYSMVESGNFERSSIDKDGNAHFEDTAGWTIVADQWDGTARTVYDGALCGRVLEIAQTERNLTDKERFEQDDDRYIQVYQTVYGETEENIAAYANGTYAGGAKTFVLSGMAKGTMQVKSGDFRIEVYVSYCNSEEVDCAAIEFSPSSTVWQYGTTSFTTDPDKLVEYIQISLVYQNNPGIGYFDNIYLTQVVDESTVRNEYYENGRVHIRENGYFQEVYEYDAAGNVTRVANNQGEIHDYTYTATNDPATETYYTFVTDDGSLAYPYTEECPDDRIQKTLRTRTECAYNDYGQLVSSVTYDAATLEQSTQQVRSSYTYETSSGSLIFGATLSETDNLGVVTKYFYDTDHGRLLASVNTSTMTGTCYTYDMLGNVTSVTPASYTASGDYTPVSNAQKVEYTYNSAYQLDKIMTPSTTYAFTYDVFGKDSTVLIGSTEVASYQYHAHNGKLEQIRYGNGFCVRYDYDELENISQICYVEGDQETVAYTYHYTSLGQLARFDNHLSGKSIVYRYDVSNRIIGYVEFDAEDMVNTFSASILYDDKSRVSKLTYTLDDSYGSGVTDYTIVYDYIYDSDGILRDFEMESGAVSGGINFTYDGFDRLTKRTYDFWLNSDTGKRFTSTASYTFVTKQSDTSTQVQSYTSQIGSHAAVVYTYTYDDRGNITKVRLNNGQEIRYVYDDLGQLLREDNTALGRTYVYAYDNAGNILTANGHTYTYGNANWKDLLTAFDGETITYDASGNPLSYYNGTRWNFTWKNGRNLASASSVNESVSFGYDSDGLRTSKRIGNVTHYYFYASGQLLGESYDGNVLDFSYDANGYPYALKYNGTTYYYITNLQGDVMYLVDSTGATVASYEYDPYGNIISATGDMAEINPLRYRGYYYDAELEMYYLQSRYYDPAVGRFVNADEALMVGSNGAVNGNNLFTYCENNPIMKSDPYGYFAIPRGVVSFAIDAAIWALFSTGAIAWTSAIQPIKAMARVWGKELIKAKLKGILSGFASTLAKIIIKVSAKLVPVIKKAVGWVFRKWAAALTAEKLAATIAGGLLSLTSNTFLNAIVSNIDVFLSVGGLVSGLWDYASDKKFDKKITLW